MIKSKKPQVLGGGFRTLSERMDSVKKQFAITKDRVKNHFTYSWWKYALILIVGILGWNFIHTAVKYRSPDHLKVEFYYCGVRLDSEKDIDDLMEQLHGTLLADMEEVTFNELILDDSYASDLALFVRAVDGEGDVYLIDKNTFQKQGLSLMDDLTPYIESGEIDVGDMNLASGYLTDSETGERSLRGIPAGTLSGFGEYGLLYEDFYLCMPLNGDNIPAGLKLFQYFLAEMK